ncbi:MAG: putative Zn-dependent protease [Myxococcota bacterium]|jgi:predicted Zn-dependent protease
MSSLSPIVEQLVNAAQQQGAIAAEAYIQQERRQRWRFAGLTRGRSSPEISSDDRTESVLSLRVYLPGGRLGVATRRGEGADSLDTRGAVTDALAVASEAGENPEVGPPMRLDIPTRGMEIDDPRRGNLEDDDRRDVISWNVGTARSVSPRIRPQRFVLSESWQDRAYCSSRSAPSSERSTYYSLDGCVFSVSRPDRLISSRLDSRHFSDVASRPLGAELANRLESGDRAAKMPDEALPLVIEPHLIALLIPMITPAFDAVRISRGESFLHDRFGTRIGPSWLHIVDDASLPSGLQTRTFDDRGVSPVPLPLIREGIASSVYLDPVQARKRNARPTGHVRHDGSLWPGNLLIRPGSRSRNMLFADLGRYLTALDFIEPPVLDLTTGELTMSVWVFLDGVDRGRGRLGGFRIKTTIFELFDSLKSLASDQTRMGMVDTCTWITEGLPLEPL